MEFSDTQKRCMASASTAYEKKDREFEYLCVDDFIGDIFHTRALATAFETGLIDTLIHNKSLSYQSLMEHGGGDRQGMRLLLGLLLENRVVDHCDDTITLTEVIFHDSLPALFPFLPLAGTL